MSDCFAVCVMGRFLHIAPNEPISDWDTSYGSPWWRDKSCQPASLTTLKYAHRLRIYLIRA
eukprot:4303479-Pyramimonas_sp.AAC.1